MMYQTEIVQPQQQQQHQPTQKIGQTQKMNGEHHIPRRFPVAPVMEQEPITCEKKIEKEHLMKQIKDLVGQVQGMFVGQQEEQCVKTEQEELLRQLKDIQCQIQDMTVGQQQTKPWEKTVEKEYETIRKMTDFPSRIQDMIMGEQKKQTPYVREHINYQPCQYEINPIELFGETMKYEQQCGKQVFGEKRRQLIEKLIQQTRILEQMLIEKQYETVYQMPKMEQLHFQLERELFEQIKKRFCELEEQIFVHGFDQEVEQKQRKFFSLLKKQIKIIEEIITPITGFETRMTMKTKEQIQREQCQQLLEKVRGLKTLLQEFVYLTCPETCEQNKPEQIETIFSVEPLTKFYNLINLPLFYDEEEIFGRQQQTKQQETEKISMLKNELEQIKSAKQELEMKLYETDRKVEQFKRQIELLEKFPKYEQQKQQQNKGEFVQFTKPEEEFIKCCFKPTIGQQQTYTTVEPKTEMMIKSRGLMGKLGEQHQHQIQKQHQQQPINKYF